MSTIRKALARPPGSGFGRELSEAGIREFVNMKTVWGKTV